MIKYTLYIWIVLKAKPIILENESFLECLIVITCRSKSSKPINYLLLSYHTFIGDNWEIFMSVSNEWGGGQ